MDVIDGLSDHEIFALYGVAQALVNTQLAFTSVNDAFIEYSTKINTFSLEPETKINFRGHLRKLNQLNNTRLNSQKDIYCEAPWRWRLKKNEQ